MRRFWSRKGNAVKKWRSKAWSIDLHETKLTIIAEDAKLSQHVPPWIYKKRLLAQITWGEGFKTA